MSPSSAVNRPKVISVLQYAQLRADILWSSLMLNVTVSVHKNI